MLNLKQNERFDAKQNVAHALVIFRTRITDPARPEPGQTDRKTRWDYVSSQNFFRTKIIVELCRNVVWGVVVPTNDVTYFFAPQKGNFWFVRAGTNYFLLLSSVAVAGSRRLRIICCDCNISYFNCT